MLAVSESLSLREIHAGLSRERRLRPVPPEGIARAVLKNHQAFVVRGARVTLGKPIGEERVLSGAEKLGVDLLRSAAGVMDTYAFIDGMAELGVSPPRASQILYGALAASPVTGVHVLRGTQPPSGAIERKIQERRGRRSPSVLSSVAEGDGGLTVTFRLSRHNLDGVLAPPSELITNCERWEGRDHRGGRFEVTIRNNFLWGIREWLSEESAEEGDVIVARFRPHSAIIDFEFVKGGSNEH
jgi:hypothetical protein